MRKFEKLSPNLTFYECWKSDTAIQLGIDNCPTNEVIIDNMKKWAKYIFQPIRNHFENPIGLNSMYRCPELNTAIGGEWGSDHTKGLAGDIDADLYPHPHVNNERIFNFVKGNLDFDQLITYHMVGTYDFVHVSYRGRNNRRQVMIKDKTGYHSV